MATISWAGILWSMKRGHRERAGAAEGAGEGAEALEGAGAVDAAAVVAAVAEEEEEGIATAAIAEEAATAAGKKRGTTNRFNFRNGESRKGTPRFFVTPFPPSIQRKKSSHQNRV